MCDVIQYALQQSCHGCTRRDRRNLDFRIDGARVNARRGRVTKCCHSVKVE
jgi:hypothetical protein